MSTCQGAPWPHYPCPHGARCDWDPTTAAPRPQPAPKRPVKASKRYTPPKGQR